MLVAGTAYAAVVVVSPTACNGSWQSCVNAFKSDNFRARGAVGALGVWRGYKFSLPISANPSLVEVGVEGMQAPGSCMPTTLAVAVSGDAGQTFGPNHPVSLPCNSDTLTWVNVTGDLASASWTPGNLTANKFRVRATCVSGSACRLDWLPARVTF